MSKSTTGDYKQYLRKCILTCVEISETQTSYQMPIIFYIGILIVYFTQGLSNIVKLSARESFFLETVQTYIHISNLAHLLTYTTSQVTIWIVYILTHFMLYAQVIVVMFLSYVKFYSQHDEIQKNTFLLALNEIYNTFFTLYVFFIFEPVNRLNFGIMVAGQHSLIMENINKTDVLNEIYYVVVGAQGLFLNLFLSILTLYFFRNFEYNDQNYMKRKYSLVCFLNLIVRLVATILFFTESDKIIGAVFVMIFGAFSVYDSMIVRPFLNHTLAQAYVALSFLFQTFCILYLLLDNDFIQEEAFMYTLIGLAPLVSEIALICYDRQYRRALSLLDQDINEKSSLFNLFCEEVLSLYERSQSDKQARLFLHQIYRYHCLNCNNKECFTYQIQTGQVVNQQYTLEILIKLVDQMFKVAITSESVMRDTHLYENISLKYISFIQKYMENTLLSFFLLKKLANNQKSLSFYFSLIFEVYSDKLKDQMKLANNNYQNNRMESRGSDGMRYFVEGIQSVEEFTTDFIDLTLKIIVLKHNIWQQLVINSNSMDDLMNRVFSKVKRVMRIRSQLLWTMSSRLGPDHYIQFRLNAAYHKIQQLFQLFIMNDIVEVGRQEALIQDLKKRDQYKEEIFLNNHNYMDGNSVIIQSGLSKTNGKILNRYNGKIPTFFGFNISEWDRIQTINDLMPQQVSIVHNQILTQYFQRGYSTLMTSAKRIFLLNKDGFLFPVSISIRNDYQSLDDCVFNVTLLKISSNRDLIMFDEFGRILGMSQQLFESLQNESMKHNRNLEYDYIRGYGFLQLLCPNFMRVMQNIRAELQLAENSDEVVALSILNLQCTLLLPFDYKELWENYIRQFRGSKNGKFPSLMNKDESEQIDKFIAFNKGYYNSSQLTQRLRLKFTIYAFYRSFENIDERILQNLSSHKEKQSIQKTMRYYVLECQEVFRIKAKNTSTTGVTLNHTSQYETANFTSPPVDSKIIETNQDADDLEAPQDNYDIISKEGSDHNVVSVSSYAVQDINHYEVSKTKKGVITPEDNLGQLPMMSPTPIDSPKGLDQEFIGQIQEIEYQKKSLLMKLFAFDKKQFFWQNPNEFRKAEVQKEEWPEAYDETTNNQRSSKIQDGAKESGLSGLQMLSNTIKEVKESDLSQLADSEENQDDDEKLSAKQKAEKYDQKRELQNHVRRDKFEQDISSANSKNAQTSFSVSDMFLEKKMPKRYLFFSIVSVCLVLTITVCTIVQIVISTTGFVQIGDFNYQVNTAYGLQSAYVKSVIGVVLTDIKKQGKLVHNFTLPLNESQLFYQYQQNGIVQILQIMQTRFDLLRKVQDELTNLQFEVITFYDQIAEHLNWLVKQSDKSYYTHLLQRLSPQYEIINQLHIIIEKQLSDLQQNLLGNFFIVFYIALLMVLVQIITLLLTYSTFLKFQEKILLVITRINLAEYENEIAKLEYARQYLKDVKGSHIIVDDFVPSYIYFRYGMKKNQDDIQQEDGQMQRAEAKNNVQGLGQILSSKIYNPTLSIKVQFVQYSIMAVLVVTFLVGAILFAIQTPAQCQQISSYYLDYSKTFSLIQQIMIFTEVKGAQPFIFHSPEEVGFENYDQYEYYYNSLLVTLQKFSNQEQIFGVNYQNNDKILDLLYGNLCIYTDFIEQNENLIALCSSGFQNFYQKGVTGFVKQLLVLFYSYQVQIDSRVFTSDEQAINFMSLSENWALLILFPDTFGAAIDTALSLIQGQLSSVTASLGLNLLIYLIVSGIAIDVFLILYFYFHFQDLNDRIQSVEFLLTMIPFEKLREQTINQMIKQITIY